MGLGAQPGGSLNSGNHMSKPTFLDQLKKAVNLVEKTTLYKKVDTEERCITAVVSEPTTVDNPDAHNDVITAEEIQKGFDNYHEHCGQLNVQHAVQVDDEVMTIEKSWIQPVDCIVGEVPVAEGSWLMKVKIHNDSLWEAVKDGQFTGLSVCCGAAIEDVE